MGKSPSGHTTIQPYNYLTIPREMKKIYIFVLLLGLAPAVGFAQEFDKSLADARKTYASGDLNNSRFAMENMLRDLDIKIGKEILQLLPTKMDALPANSKDDNVTAGGAGAGMGLYVHRTYGTAGKTASLNIINDSPIPSTGALSPPPKFDPEVN